MWDLAHVLQSKWRSLTDLQSLVPAGKYGNSPGPLKTFDNLKVNELRQELEAKGVQHCWETEATNAGRAGLYPQRSAHCTCFPPSSITSQPQYEVLAREPLHDLNACRDPLLDATSSQVRVHQNH